MPTVNEDLVNGCKVRRNSSGATFTRIFHVTGLDPTDPFNTAAAILLPDIPKYSDPPPSSSLAGLFVIDVYAEPLGQHFRGDAKVTVTYGNPERVGGILGVVYAEITGSNSLKTIHRWPIGSTPGGSLDGQLILIGYESNGASFNPFINPADVTIEKISDGNGYEVASVPILSPNTCIRFTRNVLVSQTPGNGPLALSQKNRARTNASTWQSGDAGTWMCRTFDSKSLGSVLGQQQIYEQTIEFEWQPEGWDEYALFINGNDGKSPAGINIKDGTNNGYTKVQMPRAEFSTLGLPTIY